MTALSTDRMISNSTTCAVKGKVVWAPAKSIWTMSLTLAAIIGGPLTFTWDAFSLFVITTAITICAGHSVGMHRLLIHKSFQTPSWVRYTLIYLGTLVGMAGPFGMIAAHDIRDWAQRQVRCHPLFAHRAPLLKDAWWQMHCRVALAHPPRFVIEAELANDRMLRFLERSWMVQQLPWALIFYSLGGWAWVIWGIAVRVSISLTGHWLVGHFAHRGGHQGWRVDGVAVQGFNIRHISLLTFGENWHGNHHAFPGSARLGIEAGQWDPGWWFIVTLAYLGLAKAIKEPRHVVRRPGLRRVSQDELIKDVWPEPFQPQR